ncbi:MAG: hypothetical protein KKA64_03615 [Nanoarchaeota archaeon]|nr:hypothetical protein [Nanoarchaeota archaeon]
MKTFLIIMMFFVIGALFVISNNNLAMSKQENIVKFTELYLGWVDNFSVNLKQVTGNVVRLEWFPDNSEGQ